MEYHSYTVKSSEDEKDEFLTPKHDAVKYSSGVITGREFEQMLSSECRMDGNRVVLDETDIERVVFFAIKGSRRIPDQNTRDGSKILTENLKEQFPKKEQRDMISQPYLNFAADKDVDVIQFHHFQKALEEVLRCLVDQEQQEMLRSQE